uniref:Nucleoporin NUP42 n=1 Tax=Sarcophilus harrisii TaxID=9305 RepID=A0A7N4V575_SARHA
MTICQFFLQGRCRFGERCWNEHRRGGSGGGRPLPQQYPAAPSGCSRGGWSNSSQRYSNVIQPSNFSKSPTWRGSRDPGKTSFGSFDSGASSSGSRNVGFSQKRFSSLNSNQVDGQKNEEDKLTEGIVKDMEVWESSGQWMFSVYSPVKEKPNISGFTDISPEELRLEYSNYISSNNLQSYLNSIQQLVNLWKSRLLELKNINSATKGALFSKLKNEGVQVVPTFGFQSQPTSTFGSAAFPGSSNNSRSSSVQNFSFKPTLGFGAAPSGNSTSVFGSPASLALTAASSSGSTMTSSTPTSFGFGESSTVSAASFSFKSPEVFSFGSAGFSGFPASSPLSTAGATSTPAFGGGSGATGWGGFGPSGSGANLFGLPTSGFGPGDPSSSSEPPTRAGNTAENLFTPKNELTAEELKQFVAKKFTLGKVPLKPPPEERTDS